MKRIEYTYRDNKNVHVIIADVSKNAKIGIGYVIQTYHFSIDQVINNDFTLDANNCLMCPYSITKNKGEKGKCYTHNGKLYMGLKSMLGRLHRNIDSFRTFNEDVFNAFCVTVEHTYPLDLIRLGAYGEAVLMGKEVVDKLLTLCKKHTAYTHQWDAKKYDWTKKYFMSSTHNEKEVLKASDKGFRSFFVSINETIDNGVNCPASKESGKNLTCVKCGLCNGTKTDIQKDIFILNH